MGASASMSSSRSPRSVTRREAVGRQVMHPIGTRFVSDKQCIRTPVNHTPRQHTPEFRSLRPAQRSFFGNAVHCSRISFTERPSAIRIREINHRFPNIDRRRTSLRVGMYRQLPLAHPSCASDVCRWRPRVHATDTERHQTRATCTPHAHDHVDIRSMHTISSALCTCHAHDLQPAAAGRAHRIPDTYVRCT